MNATVCSVIWVLVAAAPAWAQPTQESILRACQLGQAEQLPNPFTDLAETDWAYSAVLTLHYCGAYRGAIPPQTYQRYLQRQ